MMKFEEAFKGIKEMFIDKDVSNIEDIAIQFNMIGKPEGVFYAEVKNGKLSIEPYNYYDNDYFDSTIITYIWDNHSDIAEAYLDECCNIESWMYNYIDLDSMGEDIASDRGMYELYDGRIVEYAN